MLPIDNDQLRRLLTAAFAIVVFAVVFASLVALRVNHKGWDPRLSDAVIALIPIVVWLVVSGQLKELKFGTEGFTADFREAVAKKIGPSVKELLPIQSLRADEKGDLSALGAIIKKKDQILTFVLGNKYVLDIAKEYFTQLTQQPFFRFVEFQQNGGALYGLVDARTLFGYLKTDDDWKKFIWAISETNENNMAYLSALPGYVGASLAVTGTATKSDVLEKMEAEHTDWLPVTNPDGSLKGIVERSAILAGLVLDLNKELRQ
jgi:CBS domain-containing protein